MKRQIITLSILFGLAGCSAITSLNDEAALEPVEKGTPSAFYNISLSEELEDYTLEVCKEFEFEKPEIIFALMEKESSFNTEAISFTSDYGLMQISPINLGWLNTQLGTTDLMDPRQNIRAGVFMLDQLMDKYQNSHMALMAYNLGEHGALEYWNAGIFQSEYSQQILSSAKEIQELSWQ